ncbi:tenascin-R-like isoform X2 [Periplaneta americana]|uniref:tenascin-R-like isoform X2 n=1 Tax=Periplaneta americana TaxID=6978 RepID=UPI0037E89D75
MSHNNWKSVTLCLFLILLDSSVAEVFDVTTICRYVENPTIQNHTSYSDRVTIDVHARNNAVSLPLLSPNGTLIEPNIGINIEKCMPSINQECSWKINNFALSYAEKSALLKTGTQALSTTNLIKDIKFQNNIEFTFQAKVYDEVLNIFLMGSETNLKSSDMYYMKVEHYYSYLYKCYPLASSRYDIPYSGGYRSCNHVNSWSLSSLLWGGSRDYNGRYSNVDMKRHTFHVNVTNGRLRLSNNYYSSIIDWQDSYPIDVKFISLGTAKLDGKIQFVGSPSWIMTDESGFFKSPSFVPSSNKLCVSVTYYKAPFSVLELNVTSHTYTVIFEPISTHYMEGGWQTTRYMAQLPDTTRDSVSVLLTAQNPGVSKFLIQRILGCNGEDLEDIAALGETETIPQYGYDVAVVRDSKSGGDALECVNGGKFDVERRGCICPAGFIGKACEIGCGENFYGSKCDARCSMTSRGCQGMRLCRPKLPCACAPGLKGTHCDITCEWGEYGAECKQTCGKCSKDTCDVFTGLCSDGCKPGYFPPYCQERYTYMSVKPDTSPGFLDVVVTAYLQSENQMGLGTPRFYQIQYKSRDMSWLEFEPKPNLGQEVVVNITGLKPATHYQVRAILIDSDGNSYQDERVASNEFRTKCKVPSAVHYNLQLVQDTDDSLEVAWNYTSESHLWCPVTHFEVQRKEYWRWVSHTTSDSVQTASFKELLPGLKYEIRVRAVTVDGPAPFSDILVAHTKDNTPWKVFNFELVSKTSNKLEVKWTSPLVTAGTIMSYRVSYQCLKLLGCSKQDCSHSKGQVEVKATTAILRDLLPHAQYSVNVAALAAMWGPEAYIWAVTDITEPEVAPDPSSSSAVVQRTNTSFTVQWQPPHDCSSVNGYLTGYKYQLLWQSNSTLLKEGSTDLTTTTFTHLVPHTQYIVKVFLETSKGWNANHPLLIPVQTRATTPDVVEGLAVYKRGRRMLGIRWAPPKMTYGDIESFTISYKKESDRSVMSKILKTTPCVAWPHLFCHTINNLTPDSKYIVNVQARNVEVAEDGDPASVVAVTKEATPEAPSYIRIDSQSHTSLTIEWGLPNVLNGVLRSFLVNLEETDSFNVTDCCQYFPIQEVSVHAEKANYSVQIIDLKPASTYTISVTAKTVALSPAVTMTAHTRPPVPPMDNLIEMSQDYNELSNTPEVVVHPSQVYKDLITGYLVLVLPQKSEVEANATVWNTWLSHELKVLTNGTFYIAAEFEPSEVETSTTFEIGSDSDIRAGKWGVVQNPELQDGTKYRIGLVTVLEYCGVLNLGYAESQEFQPV